MFRLFCYSIIQLLSYSVILNAQIPVAPDRYRIEFTDKNYSSFSVNQPQFFLSERALQRRVKQGIAITSADLPVSAVYLDSLKQMGFEVLNCSRWFNSAIIRSSPEEIEKLANVGFIKRNTVVQRENNLETETKTVKEYTNAVEFKYVSASQYYGMAADQIGMLNGQALHERGFRGKGMFIAVTDGGFYRLNELSGFDSLRVSGRLRGFKNFTPNSEEPLGSHSHGTNVLSILAACLPGELIGSAPDADYLLLRSEEIEHEYLVEEDNWIAAVEYADSMGVDVINCSLGYTRFDDRLQDHRYNELDGRTVRASRAAAMAAARGIIVCVSVGNEGEINWKGVAVPADADSIIAVGAVYPNGLYAEFSSNGPTVDKRIKPDLTAIGSRTAYQNSMGSIVYGNGTSYSTPLLAGLIACFWQANPDMTNMEIIETVKRSANRFHAPDSYYGYGIPDFAKLLEAKKP